MVKKNRSRYTYRTFVSLSAAELGEVEEEIIVAAEYFTKISDDRKKFFTKLPKDADYAEKMLSTVELLNLYLSNVQTIYKDNKIKNIFERSIEVLFDLMKGYYQTHYSFHLTRSDKRKYKNNVETHFVLILDHLKEIIKAKNVTERKMLAIENNKVCLKEKYNKKLALMKEEEKRINDNSEISFQGLKTELDFIKSLLDAGIAANKIR